MSIRSREISTSIAFDPAAEGLYTASEVALAAGTLTATFVPDPAYEPSGTPTATQVAPDPDPAETTSAVLQSFDPYADLEEKVGEEDLADWEDVETVVLSDATPTLSEGIVSATAIVSPTSQANGRTTTTPTRTGTESSGGASSIRFEGIERIAYGGFVAAVSAVLVQLV